MKIAMTPARLGSQRLKKKNLAPLAGVALVRRAVRRCKAAGCFDAIYINSESDVFRPIAEEEGVLFHKRAEALGSNTATSEDFVAEFMESHPCDRLYQVHSIAPLVSAREIVAFAQFVETSGADTVLSCVEEQIECAYQGAPINFSLTEKTNSQDLVPIQRITWSLTAWTPAMFLAAKERGGCATYAGKVAYYALDRPSGIIIKVQEDLEMAEALLTQLGDGPQYGGK